MLIDSLGLKNFKCFEELDVKFAPITLLTGANSSGKSSLINAILTVLQTRGYPFYLSLNSSQYVDLGSFEDVVYNKSVKDKFEIALSLDKRYYLKTIWENGSQDKPEFVKLEYQDKSVHKPEEFITIGESEFNYTPSVYESKPDGALKEIGPTDPESIFYELSAGKRNLDFNYIGSFRLAPERTYLRQSSSDFKLDTNGGLYIDQIAEWESKSPKIFSHLIDVIQQLELINSISSSQLKGGRFELTVKVKESSKLASLPDVGFGVSQFLPIVVADLQLSDISCLAISQPEIHLHPKIQAQFGNYLSNQIKQTKKQYIVETHSEYLLNRIRLLLVTGELKPEDVRVLYFENDGLKSTVHDIEFTTKGSVKGAPQGFFDTYEMDVMDIAMQAIG